MRLSKEHVDRIGKLRWRARTDLIWLAREVLGYKDVDNEVHGPMTSRLQQFPEPPDHAKPGLDKATGDQGQPHEYTPWQPLLTLPGSRRRLILDFRGSFKTTLNVVCHTVQWILNYPDVAILIVHSRQQTAEDMLSEIRSHFVHTRLLRDLFPELAMDEKRSGARDRFTVPARKDKKRKEHTVAVASMESSVTGGHYDVIKFTDVVDATNTGTSEQCRKIVRSFADFKNILVSPLHYIDVEGTCWHQSDLYSDIIEKHYRTPVEDRQWSIYVRGVYKKDTKGKPYTFLPDERAFPDLLDAAGQKVSWFPKKFPTYQLERDRKSDEQSFANQQLNNPMATDSQVFPINLFQTKSRSDMRRVPIAMTTTSVDTAETATKGSDFSAIVTCDWDAKGRCYVTDVRHGKFLPDELIKEIFDVYMKKRPSSIRMEEVGYVRGLRQSIKRQEDLTGLYLPLVFNPPDNQRSKEERILNTLQPWFKRGEITWCDDLPCLEHFKKEISWFPKGRTDDLIDALADQFQGREWLGREVARAATLDQVEGLQASNQRDVEEKIAKIIHNAQKKQLESPSDGLWGGDHSGYYDMTGGF